MRRLSLILCAAALSLLADSCDKKQMDTLYDKQESNIESIVQRLSAGSEDVTVERSEGTVRVTVAHGDGAALQENGSVAFYYAGHFINGSSLATFEKKVANWPFLKIKVASKFHLKNH